jgi:hypothetical protein
MLAGLGHIEFFRTKGYEPVTVYIFWPVNQGYMVGVLSQIFSEIAIKICKK